MQRAYGAGLKFVSSGQITVHKFAAGHRYLCYMQQESQEQELLLRMMSEPVFAEFIGAIRRKVEDSGGIRRVQTLDFSNAKPGQVARTSWKSKGIVRPPLQPLGAKTRLRPKSGPCALDWRRIDKAAIPNGQRSGPNPRPKMLIPVASAEMVDLRFDLLQASEGAVEQLRLSVNGHPVSFDVAKHRKIRGARMIRCTAPLRERDYSIVEFDLTGGMPLEGLVKLISGMDRWIVLGTVQLRPRSLLSRVWLRLRRGSAQKPPDGAGERLPAP
jgi:hypothetical protein